MLILLPPSEGKTAPEPGERLILDRLSFTSLSEAREQVLEALISISSRPDACEILGISTGLADQVSANRDLRSAPAAPSLSVYSGVLYDALAPSSFDAVTQTRADSSLVIFSALFGILRPADKIAPYRLSGQVNLPGLGRVAAFWRRHLVAALPDDGLIIDCRSGTYAAMWRPKRALPVRVFDESTGIPKVVSHMAKHARGLIARALISDLTPDSPAAANELLNDYFSSHDVRTAAGTPLRVRAELSSSGISVLTSAVG